MKEYLSSKKITSITFFTMVLVTIGTFLAFETKCFGNSCGSDAIRGFIKPIIWFGICASVLSAFFLFFKQAVFVSFLKRVASWYLPVLFFLTITTPVSSGHIMSVDRSQVVFAGMVVLGVISVVYAFLMRKKVAA